MIRTNEEIVELKQEIEASPYLAAYKNRLRDLFDTIADLKRQLAERDAHDAHIAAESQNELVAAGWLDPEAVQQRVDEAVLDYRKRVFELLDMHRTQRAYSWHDVEDALEAAHRSRTEGKPDIPNPSVTFDVPGTPTEPAKHKQSATDNEGLPLRGSKGDC